MIIQGYAKRHEGKPEEHIVYSVRVLRAAADDIETYKRFSEFHALNERCTAAARTNNRNANLTGQREPSQAKPRQCTH